MTNPLQNFADNPAPLGDVLSDVLELVHLRGDRVMRLTAEQCQRRQHGQGHMLLHLAECGELVIQTGASEHVTLAPGDLALLSRGRPHVVRPGRGATWVSGEFRVQQRADDGVFAVLPGVILVRADSDRPWLSLSLRLLIDELVTPSPGSRVMISRILDLLFIHALREWASSATDDNAGWLTGALDPAINAALSAIHRQPEAAWTLAALAGRAQMSRAAFAARFTALVGEPPGSYLQRHRLQLAADRLRATHEPVRAVGRSVGYTSEAAFSRAFAKAYGDPPGSWRKSSS